MSSTNLLPVDVYAGQDFYVPAFRILVGTRELRKEMNDVASVTYSDSLKDIDQFSLTINNWDAESLGFKYSDGDLFNPWKSVEVWMGYFRDGQDERRRMLMGEITSMTPNFPASGGPTLAVNGLNLFHTFRTKPITKALFQKKDTEIAQALVKDIAAEIKQRMPKLELVLDPQDVSQNLQEEDPVPYLVLNNQYPIVFLLERARDIGYELTMEEEAKGTQRKVTFHFRPTRYVTRPTYVLEWGKSLTSFQPTLQTAFQVAQVTVRAWNPLSKAKFEATATRRDLVDQKVVNPADLALAEPAATPRMEIVTDHPVQTQAEAKDLAKKIMLQIAQGLVEGKGKTVGLPDLRSGVKVQLKGLGKKFNGKYVVTATTHTIGEGGYTTEFSARMEEASRT
jgi:phage protein D